ncbi:tape measure protein [Methylocaldum sp. 14B]|uniref:tape measure protein n=1 Tax=Methylocaldum sp. 14B TaxID=1912213 RepID=UPI00098AC022|nr:tape measure protein [Methylocaldum sp. 14B]
MATGKKLSLSILLKTIDQATGPIKKLNGQLQAMNAPVKRLSFEMDKFARLSGLSAVKTGLADVGREATSLGAKLGALGIGAGFLFKKAFVDPAAEFERFQSVLEQLEGSSAKARESMKWVSNFAAETPFSLGEVTDSFVKMRAYGLDPTNGLLRTLGDTGAAMGKPVMQAVEAVADAMTGENERLKEFGIRASTVGKKIVYEYTVNGQTMRKSADKNNRAAIVGTLESIWNSKYGGAMAKQQKNWTFMWQAIGDQWDRFKLNVMNSGLFDWMKGNLSDLLERINRMAADGSLEAWAKQTGTAIQDFLEEALRGIRAVGRSIGTLAGNVGGWSNLIKLGFLGIAATITGPLIAAAFKLTAALSLNPFMALLTAGTIAVAILTGLWNPLETLWPEQWERITNSIGLKIDSLIESILRKVRVLGPLLPNSFLAWSARELADIDRRRTLLTQPLSPQLKALTAPASGLSGSGGNVVPFPQERVATPSPFTGRGGSASVDRIVAEALRSMSEKEAKIGIKIDGSVPARVNQMSSKGLQVDVDSGLMGAAW